MTPKSIWPRVGIVPAYASWADQNPSLERQKQTQKRVISSISRHFGELFSAEILFCPTESAFQLKNHSGPQISAKETFLGVWGNFWGSLIFCWWENIDENFSKFSSGSKNWPEVKFWGCPFLTKFGQNLVRNLQNWSVLEILEVKFAVQGNPKDSLGRGFWEEKFISKWSKLVSSFEDSRPNFGLVLVKSWNWEPVLGFESLRFSGF